jgi:hypothetical protein
MARIAIIMTAKTTDSGGANGRSIGLGLARYRARIAVCVLSLMVSYLLQGQQCLAGNEARVRFVTTTGSLTLIHKYDDDECKKGEQELARLRNGFLLANPGPPLKKLGMPLWEFHENAATELPVAAGKRFHGMFYATKGNVKCGIPFSFDFKEGRDYEVVYDFPGIAANCTVKIFVLEGNKGSVRRTVQPVLPHRNPETCRPAFSKPRLF